MLAGTGGPEKHLCGCTRVSLGKELGEACSGRGKLGLCGKCSSLSPSPGQTVDGFSSVSTGTEVRPRRGLERGSPNDDDGSEKESDDGSKKDNDEGKGWA